MRIVNDTPFATGAIAVKAPPRAEGLSVIVKGTFTLAQGEAATIAAEQHPLCGDRFSGEGADRKYHYEDDFAPFKPRADILLVGHGGRGELASGTCRVGEQGTALANFGPVSRNTGSRAELASASGADWFSSHWPRFAENAPWDYFNAAPPEMQAEGYLQGGEEIALDNLHPRHDSFRAHLPGLSVRCFLKQEGGSAEEVSMNLDTLWLDAASDTLVLVWRGQGDADPDLETELLVVSENIGETPGAAAEYCARLDSADAAEEKAESEKTEEMLSTAGAAPAGLPPEIKLALDNPEAGTPVLAEQANLDDPRFDGLAAGDGSSDPNAGIDGVVAASGDPDSAAPTALKTFFEKPGESEDENESESDDNPEPEVPDAIGGETSKQLADLGLSQPAQESVAGLEGPSSTKDASAPVTGMAGQDFDDLPPEVQFAINDGTATAAAMLALEKIEAGAPPPMEEPGPGLDEAIESGNVPDWPPQSEDDATTIADLTAAFGADRPARGQGTSFLSLLTAIAGETGAPADATQER